MFNQPMELHGTTVLVHRLHTKSIERFQFETEAEAEARFKFVQELLTWFGTPFRDQMDIKGPNGGVDCAMMHVRGAVDTKLVEPFDPRPYPPRWMLKRNAEERMMNIVLGLGAVETETPTFGDLALLWHGWCYSHMATVINSEEYIHAYGKAKIVMVSGRNDDVLVNISLGSFDHIRPIKFFNLWGQRRVAA